MKSIFAGSSLRSLALLIFFFSLTNGSDDIAVSVTLQNHSGSACDIYWVDFDSNLTLMFDDILDETTRGLNSYEGHHFLVCWQDDGEEASLDSDLCEEFVVGNYDVTVTVKENEESGDIELEFYDEFQWSQHRLQEASDGCQDDLTCLAKELTDQIWQNCTKELLELYDRKEIVTESLRLAVCNDTSLETSEPIESDFWEHEGKSYRRDILLQQPAATISVLHNFVSPSECADLKEKGEGKLQNAVTAGSDGGVVLSSARKALAHMLHPVLTDTDSPITQLYLRGIDYANYATDYGIEVDGQEGINLIKYEPGMEYMPHCDGQCEGQEYKPGARVATLIYYCQDADVGGATTFTRSNIVVKGKPGQAVFFSYLGPDGHTDKGLTYHSGCPVLEGEKWIATAWLRLGVTKEKTWECFDPSGSPLCD